MAKQSEYSKLQRQISRRIATFEKHSFGNIPLVRQAREMLSNSPRNQRELDRSVMEMQKWLSENPNYMSYVEGLEDTIKTLRDAGLKVNKRNIGEFIQFKDWITAFTGIKYEINPALRESWNKNWNDLQAAKDLWQSKIQQTHLSEQAAKTAKTHSKSYMKDSWKYGL